MIDGVLQSRLRVTKQILSKNIKDMPKLMPSHWSQKVRPLSPLPVILFAFTVVVVPKVKEVK